MSGVLQISSGQQLGNAFVRVRPDTAGFGANLAKQLQQSFRATTFDSIFKLPKETLANVNTFGASAAGHLERAARSSGILSTNITRAFGAPLSLGAALVGKISAEFEYTLNTVRAVSGATREQGEALEAAARAAALGTKFTAQQVAEAQQFLALAGNDVATILGALPDTLSLAAAGNLELGRAADIVTNIMAGQRIEVENLGHAVDVLTATFTGANTNLEQLGTAFSYVGPVAATVGLQFEETSAALGLLGNAGIQACFDDQTEVLTSTGWVKWPEVTGAETFATVNPETHNIEYHQAVDYHRYRYTGKMYSVQTQMLDMVVTPNHKMYVQKRGSSEWELVEAQEIAGKTVRYLGAFNSDTPELELVTLDGFTQNRGSWNKEIPALDIDGDVYAKFMGYYLSEGHCDYYKGTYRVCLAQLETGDARDGMRETLEASPFRYREDKDRFTVYSEQLFRECEPFGHSHEKFVPERIKRMSPRQIRLFLEAYIEGDGDENNVIYTSSVRMRDDIQELVVRCGWTSKHTIKNRKGDESWFARDSRVITCQHDSWKVHIRTGNKGAKPWYDPNNYSRASFDERAGHKAEVFEGFVDYDGYVYDVEVPNHVLIVRRNGKIVASGNSRAGTTLRGAISKLVAPTRVGAEILDRLGVSATDTSGRMLPLVDIITQFEKSGITAGEAMKIFGQRAGPGMLALINQGSGALRKFTSELELAAGTAEEIAEVQLEGLRGAFLIAKSQFEEFALAFADSGIGEDLEKLVKSIGNFFERLSDDEALQNLITNFGKLVFATAGIAKLGGVVLGFTGKLIGLRSALSSIQALGGIQQVFNYANASVAQLSAAGQTLEVAQANILGSRAAIRNVANGLIGVAALTGAAVVTFTYFWDRYKNSVSEAAKLTNEFSETLKRDLTAGFDGISSIGTETFDLITSKVEELDGWLSALDVSNITKGIQGSDQEYEAAIRQAELLAVANGDTLKSVEELREGFLSAQARVLAYNAELGVSIDFANAFGASSDRLVAYLNEITGAAESASYSFGDFIREIGSFTFKETETERLRKLDTALKGINISFVESGIILEGTREQVISSFQEMISGSEEMQKRLSGAAEGLKSFKVAYDTYGFDSPLAGFLSDAQNVEFSSLLNSLSQVGYDLQALDVESLEKLAYFATIYNEAGFDSQLPAANIESINSLYKGLRAISDLVDDRDLQTGLESAGVSFADFGKAIRSNDVSQAVDNIEALRNGQLTEFPVLLESITTSINGLDDASRLLFTESLIDSNALLGLTLPEQRKVFSELMGTLPAYQQEAATGVLYAVHNALRQGIELPDDFLFTELGKALGNAEKRYNDAIATIFEPGESAFDGLIRTFAESGFDARLLAQFDNVDDAILELSTNPAFPLLQERLAKLTALDDGETITGIFEELLPFVSEADEAVAQLEENIRATLIPTLGDAFGQAQQTVLEDYKSIVEETSGSSAKVAKGLELLGESGTNVFNNLEEGLAAVNDELDKLLEAAINRVDNFNVLEDSGLFTAQEITVLVEEIIPQLPEGVGDSILQAVADDLADGTVDSDVTRQLQELIGKNIDLGEINADFDLKIDTPRTMFDSLVGINADLFAVLRDQLKLTPEQIVELKSTLTDQLSSDIVIRSELNTNVSDSFLEANDVRVFNNREEAQAAVEAEFESIFSSADLSTILGRALVLDPDNSALGTAFVNARTLMQDNIKFNGQEFSDAVYEEITNVSPQIEATFGDVGTEAGDNFGSALAQGMLATAQQVKFAASVLATLADTTVSNVLLINSPSRVAFGLGENFSQGLADGIISNSAAAVQAAEKLASDVKNVPLEVGKIKLETAQIEPTFDSRRPVSATTTGADQQGESRNIYIGSINTPTNTVEGTVALLSEVLKSLEAK